ncbi:MAG TPA: hypothetical protein GX401_03440, partial [Clostridiales bacterium]|nr:hypothetical protein [Clostridiales bacterium]
MRKRTRKRIQGSITLFMVIILLPTMVFGGIIVDTARINMARSAISSAGDLAMNSQLADYDTVLKEVYGLFAMSQNKTQEEITEDVKRYFETTLSSYGVVSAEDSGSYVDKLLGDFSKTLFGEEETNASNFLNMNILDITATPEPKSALSNPDILKKQIVEYMKYRAPLEFGMSFFDSLRTFSSLESQSEVVNKMVSAQESTQDVTSACKTAMDSMREYDKIFDKFALTDPYDDSKKIIVWGKGSENDYDDMVLKYRDKWGSNYSKINLLNLVFIVKELSSDDVYMYDKSGSFIDIDNHSISKGYVSLSSDEYATGDKKAALDGYISEINGSGFTYNKIFDPVCVADGSITDVNKAASQYESFRTKASSSEVKNILKLLEKARDCWAESEGQLTTARKNRSDAEEKMETAQTNISSDERLLIKNIETMITNNDGHTTSEHSSVSNVAKQSLHFSTISEIGSNQKENNYKNWFKDKLGCTFDTYTENKFSSKKISRSGLTADEVSYLNLQSNNVGVLHDNINSISANEQSYTDNKKIFDKEDAKVKALEETKESYNAMLDNIHGHIDNYQADIKTQKDYVKAAQSTVDKMASTISKQFNEIRSNLDSLNTQLSTIKSNLETVRTRIEEYQTKVKEWESANEKGKDSNPENFVKTNESDIESTLKEYDLESVKTLQTLIDGKIKTVTNFIAAMDSANRFTYGGTKIIDLKSWKEVKASAVDAGCDGFYTVSKANEKLDDLYKAPNKTYKGNDSYEESSEKYMPNLNRAKQFVKMGIYGNSSFLAYLNKTFPESKEVSEEDEESKKAYDEMKKNSKDNSSK